MKKRILGFFAVLCSVSLNAQWNGSTLVTGDIFRTDRVGIGTTLPSGWLHLVPQNGDEAILIGNGVPEANRSNAITFLNPNVGVGDNGIRWLDGQGNLKTALYGYSSASSLLGFSLFASDDIRFISLGGGGLRMILKPGGNVGIGISNPAEKLHVVGTIRSSNLAGGGNVTADGNGNLIIGTGSGGSGSDADWLVDGTGANPTAITNDIYTEGDVRIGDVNGNKSKLELNSDHAQALYVDNILSGGGASAQGIVSKASGGFLNFGGTFIANATGSQRASGLSAEGIDGEQAWGGYYNARGAQKKNIGIYGQTDRTGTDGNYGVYGFVNNQNSLGPAYAIYGEYNNSTDPNIWAGYFNGRTYSPTGFWTSSDEKLKREIKDFTGATALLKELNPKSYLFRTDEYPSIHLPLEKQYGLLAGELEQIFPEMVTSVIQPAKYDDDGNLVIDKVESKAVNYTLLIPVLVQGFKEQQLEIESLKNELVDLKMKESSQGNNEYQTLGNDILHAEVAILYQNHPNPFSSSTKIHYEVSEDALDVQLIIFDMQGGEQISLSGLEKGDASVEIIGGDLEAGMYLYSLIVDGKEVDTKRMILTK